MTQEENTAQNAKGRPRHRQDLSHLNAPLVLAFTDFSAIGKSVCWGSVIVVNLGFPQSLSGKLLRNRHDAEAEAQLACRRALEERGIQALQFTDASSVADKLEGVQWLRRNHPMMQRAHQLCRARCVAENTSDPIQKIIMIQRSEERAQQMLSEEEVMSITKLLQTPWQESPLIDKQRVITPAPEDLPQAIYALLSQGQTLSEGAIATQLNISRSAARKNAQKLIEAGNAEKRGAGYALREKL